MSSIIVICIFMVALVGITLAATPYLMPPTECFTVTVPPSAKQDPRVRALYRSYVMWVALATLAGIGASAFVLPGASDSVAAVTISVATLLPMVASLALMLRARSHVSNLKQAEGWTASGSRSVAFVGGDDVPQPAPLAWELLHLVIIAALAAFVLLAYDRLPEQLPMHADMGGTVTDYAAKSPRAVLLPILEAVFMGVVFTLCHLGILRSKRPVDPEAPATSAYAYGRFAQVQSLVLLVGGLALNVSMGTALLLSWLGIMGLEASGILVSVVALAFVLVEIWVSVRMGQSGGRMAAELRTSDGVARDDDRYYKLGFAYVNPDDPSIWVPKRFGVGWTLNFGQPMAWVTIGLFAALVAGFAAWALRLEG